MSLRRIWAVIVASLLIAAAVVMLFRRVSPLTVDWTVVAQRPAIGWIIAAGRISDDNLLQIVPSVDGSIKKVFVADGSSVSAGDTLVTFDNKVERIRRERCANDVAIASIRLEQHSTTTIVAARENVVQAAVFESLAQKKSARSDSIFQQGSISLSELDETNKELAVSRSQLTIAEADLAAATSGAVHLLQAQLAQARLALEAAELELARTIVTAPSGGKVCNLTVRPGMQVSTATPLMWLLAANPAATVIVQVDEDDVASLRDGQKARIGCAGLRSINAAVRSVVDRIDSVTHTATVVLSMQQPQPPLLPGQRVYACIETGNTAQRTILLDRRFCIGESPSPDVYVKHGRCAVRRALRCNVISEDFVSVRSGIVAGDTVVSAAGLSANSQIRLNAKPAIPIRVPCIE